MKKNGFTLFELLVSISIIAILTALVSLSYSAVQKKARDARRRQDMGSVQKAAEQYYSLSGYNYPSTTAPADWEVDSQAILNVFPTDPKGTGWTGYSCSSIGATAYCCCAKMEDDDNGNSAVTDCSGFATTGDYYCIKSQQ